MDWLATNKHKPYYILGLFLLCILVYGKVVFFDYISWDDPEMVFKNRDVTNFKIQNLFSSYYVGNYIPMTMLVHSISYLLFKDWAGGHHLINILFHLINGWLLYKLLLKLNFKFNSIFIILGLFLIHPLQVETVVWISELKTILMLTFFILSCHFYLRYLNNQRIIYFIGSLVMFVLACFSKSYAVILPFFLLAIDYLLNNKFTIKSVIYQTPFFIISLLVGLLNIKAQTADQFINYSHDFHFYQKLCNAGFAIFNYLKNYVAPVNLYPLYAFPEFTSIVKITGITIILAMIALIIYALLNQKYHLLLILVLSVISLILVLQFIPFGEALFADRYMYLSTICFSFALAGLINKSVSFSKVISVGAILIFAGLSLKSISPWENSKLLFSHVVKNEPGSFVALNSLGTELMFQNENQLAENYLNQAIASNPKNHKGYYNLGLLYTKINQPIKAIDQFNKTLSIIEYNKAIVARANAYYMLRDYSKAMQDASYAIKKDTLNDKAYFVLGNCYNDINDLNKALTNYNKAINLANNNPEFYLKKGIVLGKLQDFNGCREQLNNSIELQPDNGEAYYWRGVASVNLNQNPCNDFQQAVKFNYPPASNALNKYCP
jgi:tetratricopeptide (TPR) repeat protein